jgi:hypothetical protein
VVVVVVLATDWIEAMDVTEFERGLRREDVERVGIGGAF